MNQFRQLFMPIGRLIRIRFIILLTIILCLSGTTIGAHAADYKGTIRIGGSGGSLAIMKELATAFQKKYPEVQFVIPPSLGSSGGIKASLAGSIDLGLSSRPLTAPELQQGAVAVEYARSPFIFVTTYKVEGVTFTLKQIASIYAGEIKNWPDGTPIRLILRPEAEANTRMLKNMSPEMDKAVQIALSRKGLPIAITDQENLNTIERIQGAIGACSLAQVVSEKRKLNPLALDGVIPSVKALVNGTYPYYTKFFMITGPNPSPITKSFIEFVNSPGGRSVLTKLGHFVGDKKP